MPAKKNNKMPEKKTNHKYHHELIRVGKQLNEVVLIKDAAGNLLHKIIKPVAIELYPQDIMQIIVGATLLSIPVAYTEEVWMLGQNLPWLNILLLMGISMFFVGMFIYYNTYRVHFKDHKKEFFKRMISTYVIALMVAFLILFLLDKAPLGADALITFKRMIILSLPASMSAAVADMIK